MSKSSYVNNHEIRQKAEVIYQEKLHNKPGDSEDDIQSILEELRIHQIELELQNQELIDAQANLELMAEQYADLYELAPVGYLTIDKNGFIKRLNLTAVALLGGDRKTWPSKPIMRAIEPSFHSLFHKHLRETLESEKSNSCELQIVHKNGKKIWVRMDSIVEFTENQMFCRSSMIDITEKKETEIALTDSEKRLKLALEGANEGLWDWNLRENTISFFGIWKDLPGETEQTVDPSNSWWFDSIHPEDRERVKNLFNAHFEGLTAFFESEYRIKSHNGDYKWVLVHGRVIERERSGQAIRAVGTLIDITNQKKIQKRLNNAKRMESLGRLAGGVAHDLNNILVGMIGYPELMLSKMHKDDPLRKYVEKIRNSSLRAKDTVQDILTLARRGLLSKEPLSLNTLVKQYLDSPEFHSLQERNPDIDFHINLADDILTIEGSENHIYKSIMNLVINAKEAIVDGGRIGIHTEYVYLDESIDGYMNIPQGEYAVIKVTDDGVGIDPDDLDQIFDPFYSKKPDNHRGTGLGLSIIWGTLLDHFGYLDIHTKTGEGTEFRLYFPISKSKLSIKKQVGNLTGIMGNHERILLVDDRQDQRDIASSILESLQYEVETTDSGEKAIEILETNDYDLVLLDMIMPPGLDGLETYTKITEFKPDQKTIILTGYAETDRLDEARALGIKSFIRKPYVTSELARKIKKVFS